MSSSRQQERTSNRALVYIRVSTDEQARHGVSLDAQSERLEAYCIAAGLEVQVVVREEGVSASVPLYQRSEGSKLANYIKAGVRHIVALKLDRLFRDAEDALHQTKAWDKAGIALHLVDIGGQTVNSASAMGRMMLTMMAGFAELERNLIAERTASALAHKKAHRQVFNHTPFGFERRGRDLIPIEAEQAVVRRIKAARGEDWTLQRIADELNADGVPTKTGSLWQRQTVSNILSNSIYA